jgi:hypothetical protein
MSLINSSYVLAIHSSDEKNTNVERRNLTTYGLEPIYRLTANIGKIPGLENAKIGEKVELEARISIAGTSLEVDIYHNEKLVSTGVTKVHATVKTKYVKGTSGEEKKRWRLPIFSLIRNY